MGLAADADENRSPLTQILTWFLFLVGVFSLCARVGSKLLLSIRIALDDWLILTAQTILLFQCISVSYGAANGLGKPVDTLSQRAVQKALQAEYAYIPLFVLALALIKWSMSAFINELSPNNAHRRQNLVIAAAVTLWFLTGALVSLFQCAMPTPWDFLSNTCVNRKAWWAYVVVLDIATELGFMLIYFSIFHGLQTSLLRKASVLGIFSARILVVCASSVQLAVFHAAQPTPGGGPYNGWAPVVCNQVVACLSVVTACLPYLKPFMQSIELSVVQVHENGSQEELSQRRTQGSAADGRGHSGRVRVRHFGRSDGGGGSGAGFFTQLSQIGHPAAVHPSSIDTDRNAAGW